MKKLYEKHIKNIFKNNRYLTAFLVVIIFISFISSILSDQSNSSPHNPIEGISDNASNVVLAGDSSMSEKEDIAESEQEKAEENKNEDDEDDEEKDEKNENKANDSEEDKESNERNDKDISPDESDGDGGGLNDDSENMNIIDPNEDKNLKNSNVNNYFTTSIKNYETLTKENYSFSIIQKNHGLDINKIEIFLNENLLGNFKGAVNLKEGKNAIKISISYEDIKGKNFTVSREYTVYYNQEDIVINTSLRDGMKLTNPELSFTASAKIGPEILDVIVKSGKDELNKEDKDNYNVVLNEGENKITISASDGGITEEKTFVINYIKHYPEITIITDIKEYQEIKKSEFKFNALAKVEDRTVDITATQNGSIIQGDKDGNYKIDLIAGSNYIILKASDDGKTISKQYEIMYESRPDEDEDWEDPNKPIIETDLKNNITIKSNKHNIWVKAKDHKGNKLNAGHIEVKANSKIVPINWTDGDQTSYTLPIVNDTNRILITVWDDNNNLVSEEYIIKGIVKEDGDPIGHATISVDANTIGLGNIIPPTEVEIRQGEPATYVLDRLLKDHGFTYGNTGTLDSGFYLSYIDKPGIVSNPSIPEQLDQLMQESGFEYRPEDYQTDSLGEFDFSSGSGWMYSVNGHYPNYGFADKFLVDGEVVRIRFTLALGEDIGGSGGMGGSGDGDWGDW